MPRRDEKVIYQHETLHRTTFRDFINSYWVQNMVQPLPDFSTAKGTVEPVIEYSRWIVTCPAKGCQNANLVSRNTPFWICVECGSPENDEVWYNIAFPADADDVEKVLLNRPKDSRHSGYYDREQEKHVIQDLETLRQENRDKGLPDR